MEFLKLNELTKRKLEETYVVVYAIKNEINIKKADIIEKNDIYTLIGVDIKGIRQLLNIYADKSTNNHFSLDVFESLKSRGVKNILFLSVDDEKVEKQDCEIKAFKRLAEKIKKEYPRLKILIGADALYASKPVMDICKDREWKYIIRFKEGAIPTLYKEFKEIVAKDNESKKENYEYVKKLDYQEEKINIIKNIDKNTKIEYVYITDLPISDKNIETTIGVGRKRWKIENEGFNIQKNGTFDIGHLYSKDSTAIKVHYLMIQMAHIIRQLLEKGIKEVKELRLKLKEISQKIKEQLISSKIQNLTVPRIIQLRFD